MFQPTWLAAYTINAQGGISDNSGPHRRKWLDEWLLAGSKHLLCTEKRLSGVMAQFTGMHW